MRTIVCVLLLLVCCDSGGPKEGAEVTSPDGSDEVQVDAPVIETGCTTCECTPGATEACGVDRPPWCKAGTRVCSPDGMWGGECLGEVPPAPSDTCELGNDANCNNIPNEGCPCIDGEERCGPCGDGTMTCVGGVRGECLGATPASAACGACGQGTSTCGGPCVGDAAPTASCGPCNDGVSTCGGACQGGTPATAVCGPCGQGVSTCGGPCVGDPAPSVACGPCNDGLRTCGGPCQGGTALTAACGVCGQGVSTCGGACVGDAQQTVACGTCNQGVSTCGGACVGAPASEDVACGVCGGGTSHCGGPCVGAPASADVACGVCGDGNNHCGGGCSGARPSRCPPGWADRGATCVAETYVLQHIWESASPFIGYVSGCQAGTCLQHDLNGDGAQDNRYGADTQGSMTIRYRWTHVQGNCLSDDQPALMMDCELRDETLSRRQSGSQQVNSSEFVHGDFGSWCDVFKAGPWSADLSCIKQLELWVTLEIPTCRW